MRLSELFDPEVTHRSMTVPFDIDGMRQKREKSYATSAYAHGKVNPKDPGEFRKTTYMPSDLDNDAYYQYIKAASPYMKSNPFLPRVYVIDIKSDSTSLTKPTYRIEKLHSPEELSTEAIEGMAVSLFPELGYLGYPVNWQMLLSSIRDVVVGNEFTDNPGLQQVSKIIRELVASNDKFETDMHSDNFMVRLTPAGPQLVFLDPISDTGHSIVGDVPWGKSDSRDR